MIAWIKSLFKKDIALEHREQEPVISEPVLTLAELWKKDKKRFKFTYAHSPIHEMWGGAVANFRGRSMINCDVNVLDRKTKEFFDFSIILSSESIKSVLASYWLHKFSHKVYPILGYDLYSQPSWMTYDEAKYLCDLVKPYFKERVERYSKLVDYREDRKVEAGKRQTERAKQEERQRLVNLYTKES